MRTLIVDNYDSFTYNLFHMIAAVNGRAPVVVMNDEPGWDIGQLDGFDNVVISPGPGHPKNPQDFGICRDIIARSRIPVLGVCLGHQGIALHEGATVGLAPAPRHGELSQVTHTGTEILAGIPSPFDVVRYHSLAVTQLPDSLEALAHSEDGILMALRHRARPVWGVQFHPESISSTYGEQIIRNFADLTRQEQASGRCPRPCVTAQLREAPAAPTPVRAMPPRRMTLISRKMRAPVSSEHAFEALFRDSEHAFWLDSSLSNVPFGRFSFMGDASGPLARVATADVTAGNVTIDSADGRQVVQSGFFDWISADLARHETALPADLPFEFALGWVGYLGYELKTECRGAPAHRSPHPDAAMVFADRALAFDHLDGSLYLLALAPAGDEDAARHWLGECAAQLVRLADEPRAAVAPAAHLRSGQLALRHDRIAYLDLIERSQQAIIAGDTYEVCLTNMITATAHVDPWSSYCALRHANPVPFAAYLQFEQLSVLSGSPERFLSISSDGLAESKPIKGTRPRGANAAADERLRQELLSSDKERAENLMIVDLVRNDLGACAAVGTVHVPKLFDIETYATVHQLVSTIRADLRSDMTAVECVRAAFPGGSMTGAPKISTMAILDQLEAGPRGVYSGSIGYFSLSGAADFNIVIRTMIVTPGEISFGVGGAITALSNPDEEFEETAVKATSLLRLFKAQFPGRIEAAGAASGTAS
ncbi:MAG: aminodeoxychorismate synthase component I [Pseudomonadota bacterium]